MGPCHLALLTLGWPSVPILGLSPLPTDLILSFCLGITCLLPLLLILTWPRMTFCPGLRTVCSPRWHWGAPAREHRPSSSICRETTQSRGREPVAGATTRHAYLNLALQKFWQTNLEENQQGATTRHADLNLALHNFWQTNLQENQQGATTRQADLNLALHNFWQTNLEENQQGAPTYDKFQLGPSPPDKHLRQTRLKD